MKPHGQLPNLALSATMRVLVSSTYSDLVLERGVVRDVLAETERAGFTIMAMEDLGASPSSPADVSIAMAEKADLAVLLLGARYGTVPADEQLSLTQQEYEALRRAKVPCLAYVCGGALEEPGDSRVRAFRRRVQDDLTVRPVGGLDGLRHQLRIDLDAWLACVVAPDEARSAVLDTFPSGSVHCFVGREPELRALDEALTEPGARVGILGATGYGKTSLVRRYLGGAGRVHNPIWLRMDDLMGRDAHGAPRPGARRWGKEALLERLLSACEAKARPLLVFDNVQAAPDATNWIVGRLGGFPAVFLSWDAEALPPCRVIRVPLLPREIADLVILDACTTEQYDDRDEVRALCDRLENHPLLLDLAARRLRLTPSLTIAELLEEIAEPGNAVGMAGATSEGRTVQLRTMLLASYRCLEPVERTALSAVAAFPASGVSATSLAWLFRALGAGERPGFERAEQLGLLEGRAAPDWRGHRFRLRSLVREFLGTTDAHVRGQELFTDYLGEPDALSDSSLEVVSRVLERWASEATPAPLPEGWLERVLVQPPPAVRDRALSVLMRLQAPHLVESAAEGVEALLQQPHPEDVTVGLLRLLGRWRQERSRGVVEALWHRPVILAAGERELSRDVEAEAAQAFARIDGRTLADLLRDHIKQGTRRQLRSAVTVAGRVGETAVVDTLTSLLASDDVVVRRIAASSFEDFEPEPQAREQLAAALERDPDPEVRSAAASSLGVWEDERAEQFFLAQLDSSDPEERATACSVLWRLWSPAVADRLAEIARNDPDSGPRGTALFVLANWADPRVADIILEKVRAGDEYEQMVALGMVGSHSGLKPGPELCSLADAIAELLKDDRLDIRLLARAALISLQDVRALSGLWRDLSHRISPDRVSYRWHVVARLRQWAPETLEVLRLRPLLHDPDPDMRAAATLVAGQLRATDLAEDLESLLEDPAQTKVFGAVSQLAAEALDRIADKLPPWKPVPPRPQFRRWPT